MLFALCSDGRESYLPDSVALTTAMNREEHWVQVPRSGISFPDCARSRLRQLPRLRHDLVLPLAGGRSDRSTYSPGVGENLTFLNSVGVDHVLEVTRLLPADAEFRYSVNQRF